MLFIQISGIQMLLLQCVCHVLLQYLDAQLHILQNLEPLFIRYLTLLQRQEALIHVLH